MKMIYELAEQGYDYDELEELAEFCNEFLKEYVEFVELLEEEDDEKSSESDKESESDKDEESESGKEDKEDDKKGIEESAFSLYLKMKK